MFFFWILFLSILCLPASRGWTIITAEAGQTVSLPCRAGRDGGIRAVEWSRSDLGSDYVFLFKNKRPETEAQHESYQNRVDLQDRQMKDRDVSLVLKDVTIDDAGTYECRVRQRRGTDHTAIVYLEVSPPERIIRVTAGDDVILPCQVPPNYKPPYDAVEWIRGEGNKTRYVYINGTSDPNHKQDESYQNRTDLQDRQMKDGDVSLVLKDVTINDAGTYGCRVRQRGGNRRKRDVGPPIISIVHLEVSPPPPPSGGTENGGNQHQGDQDGGDKDRGGRPGLAVSLSAAVIIVMAVAGVWIIKKKKNSASPFQPNSGENDPMSPSD